MFNLIKNVIKYTILLPIAVIFAVATVQVALTWNDPENVQAREQVVQAREQSQVEREERRLVEEQRIESERAEDREAEFERQRQAEAVRITEAQENRRNGFHCLSEWNGSHRGVVDWLKDNLRDPDSYEHIETRITPVNTAGEHTLLMQYRARNGFGGMNVGNLTATVQNKTCQATIIAN